jgi:hypothetical protein
MCEHPRLFAVYLLLLWHRQCCDNGSGVDDCCHVDADVTQNALMTWITYLKPIAYVTKNHKTISQSVSSIQEHYVMGEHTRENLSEAQSLRLLSERKTQRHSEAPVFFKSRNVCAEELSLQAKAPPQNGSSEP